ncbi:domain found in IF2B/IF5-domain-containing protein [Coprinopsis sp. MPI-PUGE-AT-0042]|nr:domain found in IF2B/IF5-domain-containing protein [Coprinopsis sp. MPI-PUGE-AT-0042]
MQIPASLPARVREPSLTAAADEGEEGDPVGTPPHLDNIDEAKPGEDPLAMADAPSGIDTGSEPWLGSDRDYSYQELLSQFYSSLHTANPALASSSRKRYTIAPPKLCREANQKSNLANVTKICKKMHRQPEHVVQFLFAKMGTTGSVDGAGRLVIKGRFQQKERPLTVPGRIRQLQDLQITRYLLTKENRIFFVASESCGSRRSVNPIKSGFQAQVGKRSKNKTS